MAKKTARENYLAIKAVLTDENLIKFVDHQIELLDAKNSSRTAKSNERAAETAELGNAVYAAMEDNRVYTVTELQGIVPEIAFPAVTNQRATRVLAALAERGLVVRTEVKRKAYWQKVLTAVEGEG